MTLCQQKSPSVARTRPRIEASGSWPRLLCGEPSPYDDYSFCVRQPELITLYRLATSNPSARQIHPDRWLTLTSRVAPERIGPSLYPKPAHGRWVGRTLPLNPFLPPTNDVSRLSSLQGTAVKPLSPTGHSVLADGSTVFVTYSLGSRQGPLGTRLLWGRGWSEADLAPPALSVSALRLSLTTAGAK